MGVSLDDEGGSGTDGDGFGGIGHDQRVGAGVGKAHGAERETAVRRAGNIGPGLLPLAGKRHVATDRRGERHGLFFRDGLAV
jgi:hypothetical protein